MKCVEMYDGSPFCGDGDGYSGVMQEDWHFQPKWVDDANGTTEQSAADAVKQADCPECLRRIALLGHAAERRLVEVLAPGAAAEMLNRPLKL